MYDSPSLKRLKFTAGQAAQKTAAGTAVAMGQFTAGQAAQKIRTGFESFPILFTAGQAAQKWYSPVTAARA